MELPPKGKSSECISFLMVMHKMMLYAKEKISTHARINLFIFLDTPDLIKTPGNCLFNSGSGQCTQGMWNSSGFFVLWSHISRLYYEDFDLL